MIRDPVLHKYIIKYMILLLMSGEIFNNTLYEILLENKDIQQYPVTADNAVSHQVVSSLVTY